jgi:hypothetical protein|tara:strand:- start:970 stop:1230 length:261 start_codon:yes stop_codon:yes gene_type:complete
MVKKKKHTLLLGEGIHQHTLYGEFSIDTDVVDYTTIEVTKDSLLQHELPNGKFGEHKTLKVDKGTWVMGKQVEYNPFSQKVERVYD